MTDVRRWTGRSRPAALGRRQFVWATVAVVAGVAAARLVTACGPRPVRSPYRQGPGSSSSAPDGCSARLRLTAASPGFDDSGLQVVTLPHTVTKLSWQEWDPASWEGVWIYRKHFDAPAEAAGMRIFADFAAAMTQATLTLNGHGLPGHVGGYLPFSAEITNRLMRRGNVLAVTLDSRFNRDVPPDRPPPCAPGSVDFWQPGGLYREARLRIVPQVFLADVFAKPVNVLEAARRQVVVQCTVDAAVMPRGSVTVLVELLDGAREISSVTVPVTITKPGQVAVTGTLSGLAGITLWDIDNPKLYTVLATLQRPQAQAVRRQPAPVLPVRRRRHVGPGAAQGRGDLAAGAELQHGPVLALPVVGGLLRRLR